MNAARPLEGKRIVVTRTIEQARHLKEILESMGAVVLLLPAISFSESADTTELDGAIRALESFDWVLFTSANAVKFFANRCRKLGAALGGSEKPRFAAVGPATASVAAAEGCKIDYVAREFLGIALAREVSESIAGKNVLLPRSDHASRDLPEALKAAGADVTEVMTYHTGGIGAAEPGVIDAVREARVDVVSFFSPSAVESLRGELGEEVLSRLGEKAALAAVGPVTAAALRKAGLRVAIQAPEATAESMSAAIQKYFSAPSASQARSL
jgi:uroporphyrinogen III methyltransferase/synthase